MTQASMFPASATAEYLYMDWMTLLWAVALVFLLAVVVLDQVGTRRMRDRHD